MKQRMWAVLNYHGKCIGVAETKQDAYDWRSDYEDFEGISQPHSIKIVRCLVEYYVNDKKKEVKNTP